MSDVLRWTVVANPASAAGKTKKIASDVVSTLRAASPHEIELVLTEAPGHASELVKDAVDRGTDCVISIGGDGTHHEVLNGFLEPNGQARNPECCFGILPSGTGGDFARLLYTTRDPNAAAKKLVHGTPRLIDVGSCHYTTDDDKEEHRFFLNIGSFGMGGLVVRLANDGPKFMGAKGTFLLGVARSVLKYRNCHVRMTVNGADIGARRIRLVGVSNGQFFGGGMRAAPSARLDDGLFDVVSLGDVPMRRLVRLIGRVYKGAHVRDPDVDFVYGSTVDARPEEDQRDPVLVELDGEGVGKLPARFELLEKRIRLMFPSNAPIENS